MGRKRNAYFDFLKGVLILSVLLGHSIQYGSGSACLTEELYWEHPVMKGIYSFHMPLFAAVSGYFFYFSVNKYGPVKACLRRWKKLIVPIAAWVPPIVLLMAVVSHTAVTLKLILTTFLTNFWFLWAMLIGSALICMGERIKRNRLRIAYYVFVFLLFFITPDVLWIVAAYKFVLPFYFLGFCVGKHKNAFANWNHGTGILLLLGWLVLLGFYQKETYINTKQFTLFWNGNRPIWHHQLMIDLYRYLIAFLGCGAIAYLSLLTWRWLRNRKGVFYHIMLQLGRHSLAVYILSNYVYLYIVPAVTKNVSPSVVLTAAVTAAVAAMCMAAAKLLGKSKWLSAIFLGE